MALFKGLVVGGEGLRARTDARLGGPLSSFTFSLSDMRETQQRGDAVLFHSSQLQWGLPFFSFSFCLCLAFSMWTDYLHLSFLLHSLLSPAPYSASGDTHALSCCVSVQD
jgi:hypothetical protein